MKRLSLSVISVGMAAVGTAWAGQPVPKSYAENLRRSPVEQVCRASEGLIAAQKEGGWSWQRGDAREAPSISGVVAAALAATSARCDATAAVVRYAEAAIVRHQKGEFLYDPDVEALVGAADLTGDPRYREVAKEAFDRRYAGASGEEIVERWFMLKRDRRLIGYDAASAIRAALAVGEREKAEDIAAAAVKSGGRWVEGWDPRGFLTTSRGALLEALSRLGTRRFAGFQKDLADHLILTQGSDGSWEGRNTQATAFAVRGLNAYGSEAALTSAQLGARWLRLTQLQDGSWATFNDLLPEPFVGEVVHEVTAEVVLALR
ncbi:MAG: hypothetical protein IRZ16_04120 [Myxococcaceae bacterium]|nr:hypothetical protein [Myxococcaceae bacterium]